MEKEIFTEDQLLQLSMLPLGSVIDIYSDTTDKNYVLKVVPFTGCTDCFFGDEVKCSFYLDQELSSTWLHETYICVCQNSLHSKIPRISYKQI